MTYRVSGLTAHTGGIGERGISFETLARHHLGRETFEHALTATVLDRIEAAQHYLQVGMTVERDTQHLPLNATVGALDHAIGLRRVGARHAMLYTVLFAGGLESIGCEAGAPMGDPEG